MRQNSHRRALRVAMAVVAGLVLGSGLPPAADAQWVSSTVKPTGTYTMAAPAYRFSGPAATTYTIAYTIVNFVDTDYPVLTNTGATPASYTGQIQPGTALPLGSLVGVRACATPWTAGTCPAGAVTLLAPTWLAPMPTLAYQAVPIPAGGRVHLQVKVGGFLATASITLTVTSAVLPTGGANRTAG
ncbi:hypothetical protein GCM10010399_17590 [Dactylosporangium fulvum]|uniref:Uncharacterized protein n=1 Tax=Dactylosporangium fulvum TaxID=53359 RepID=A0ABY5VX92_9ACTN|nr:hypothetical protein [Dactylosporangium fulvum]UWP80411.1 hypothetical protein Dfulv_35355 [Dactylosporangium fulvum]